MEKKNHSKESKYWIQPPFAADTGQGGRSKTYTENPVQPPKKLTLEPENEPLEEIPFWEPSFSGSCRFFSRGLY